MTGMHKRELERQGATDHGNRLLWFLVVVTIASGGVGLVAFFREERGRGQGLSRSGGSRSSRPGW